MSSGGGSVRSFLRLLYATFERSRDVFGTYPNFYWARHFVTTLLTLNMLAALMLGAKAVHVPLPGRHAVGAWLPIIITIALFGMWLTRGLENSEETTTLRNALDLESTHDAWVRRGKVSLYVVLSVGLFLYIAFAT